MILVQSSDGDISTDRVLDWMFYLGFQVCRINGENYIDKFTYKEDKVSFSFINAANESVEICLDEIKTYWYRRGYWNLVAPRIHNGQKDFIGIINEFYDMERNGLTNFFNQFVHEKIINLIGNSADNRLNKIGVLNYAKSIGLEIPCTMITSEKSDLIKFFKEKNGKIITKAIVQGPIIEFEKNCLYAYTELVSKSDIDEMPECFYPTLFQEAIEKKFELRIFYLKGKFFTTAIFSQNDSMTIHDFRNYNHAKPNRTPPFNLPSTIKHKISALMKYFNLQTGSIDMIYSVNREYIFLEVNPIGQFHQVSYPGNFYLEKEIAKELGK